MQKKKMELALRQLSGRENEENVHVILNTFRNLLPNSGELRPVLEIIYDWTQEFIFDKTLPPIAGIETTWKERALEQRRRSDDLVAKIEQLVQENGNKIEAILNDADIIQRENQQLLHVLTCQQEKESLLNHIINDRDHYLKRIGENCVAFRKELKSLIVAKEQKIEKLNSDLRRLTKYCEKQERYKRDFYEINGNFSAESMNCAESTSFSTQSKTSLAKQDLKIAQNYYAQLMQLRKKFLSEFDCKHAEYRKNLPGEKEKAFEWFAYKEAYEQANESINVELDHLRNLMMGLMNKVNFYSQETDQNEQHMEKDFEMKLRGFLKTMSSQVDDMPGNQRVNPFNQLNPEFPALFGFNLQISNDGVNFYDLPRSFCSSCQARMTVCPHQQLGQVFQIPTKASFVKITRSQVEAREEEPSILETAISTINDRLVPSVYSADIERLFCQLFGSQLKSENARITALSDLVFWYQDFCCFLIGRNSSKEDHLPRGPMDLIKQYCIGKYHDSEAVRIKLADLLISTLQHSSSSPVGLTFYCVLITTLRITGARLYLINIGHDFTSNIMRRAETML
ncbi:hypothetical protein Ciccas_005479 [Cichlidogyrus casuarinus]|uniref:Uncharacterized protein n=1 Tax=Cichlidogyrus casuarinus TaxID=1844966 RepID=A0ABD2QAV3_9PLAT